MKFDFLKKINWEIIGWVFLGLFAITIVVCGTLSNEPDPEIIQIEVPQHNLDSTRKEWKEIIDNPDSVTVWDKIRI